MSRQKITFLICALILTGCRLAGGQDEVPVGRETAVPTPDPLMLAEEVERSLDKNLCPDHCWHGLYLGQSNDDALAEIYEDPTTDLSAEIFREEDNKGNTTYIDWEVGDGNYASISFNEDGIADTMDIPLTSLLPLGNYLNNLGPPDLMMISFNESKMWVLFWLIYLEKGMHLEFRLEGGLGAPLNLTEENLVERVSFFDSERANKMRCLKGFYRWGGLGDISKYYVSNDYEVISLPPDCYNE